MKERKDDELMNMSCAKSEKRRDACSARNRIELKGKKMQAKRMVVLQNLANFKLQLHCIASHIDIYILREMQALEF